LLLSSEGAPVSDYLQTTPAATAALDPVRAALAGGDWPGLVAAIDQAVAVVDTATAATLLAERGAQHLQRGSAQAAAEDAIAALLRDTDTLAGLHLLVAATVELNLLVPAVLCARVLQQHQSLPGEIAPMIAELASQRLEPWAGAIEAGDEAAVASALSIEAAKGAAAGRLAVLELLRHQPVNVAALQMIGVMWSEAGLHALAAAFLGHLAAVRPSHAPGQFALDRALCASDRHMEAFARRQSLMTDALRSCAPPLAHPAGSDPQADDGAAVSAQIRARGFAVLRGALDLTLLAEMTAHLFASDADAPFARPRDLPPTLIAALLRRPIWPELQGLGLTALDGTTSFARQVRPNGGRALDLVAGHFHQDSQVFFQPLINVWVPLDPCGETAPALSFATDPNRQILPTEPPEPTGPGAPPVHHTGFRIHEATLAGRPVVSPVLAPGDAVLFLGSVPHRTYVTAAMTERRRSVELRFVQPEWAHEPIALPF
jgi:hypothetical protein